MQPAITHADEDATRMSDTERHRRAYLLRMRFTGRIGTPNELLPAMIKLFTLPLHPDLCEADLLALEGFAKRRGIPEASIPENTVIL